MLYFSIIILVILIVILIENGPVVLDNVQIIENIEVVEVEVVIVTVLRDLKIWDHLWKECDLNGMIGRDMDMIIMVEAVAVLLVVVEVEILGAQIIMLLLTMATITMATIIIVAGSFVLL